MPEPFHRVHRGVVRTADAIRLAALAAAVACAAGAACASTDDGAIIVPSVTTADHLDASDKDGVRLQPSEATVEVGDTVYRFSATCYAPGAGDLLVLGVAEDPESDRLVEMYLQAFIADPYIGLRLGDGRLIEAALDAPLDLYIHDDLIRASAVRFVRSLDLRTGDGEDVGFGSLEVYCSGYSDDLPGPGS